MDEKQQKLAQWANDLKPFVSVTVDQLRTFVAVHETGSARAAAIHVLKRDQSSVEKQLKTLDEHFWNFNKERLIIKPQGRGAELRFTRGGERVYQLARKVLQEFSDTRTQFEKVYRLRIALTKFTIPLLAEVEDSISKRLRQHGRKPERELIHIRSELVQQCLEDPSLDFSLGGIVTGQPIDSRLQFIPWKSENLLLLSNLPLHCKAIQIAQLRSLGLPLILPTTGVIKEFVTQALGGAEGLNVVEWCNDLQFGLDLLRLRVHEACMICTEFIAAEARNRKDCDKTFYTYRISDCKLKMETGLFRRAGEDELYEPTHPVRIFWETFRDLAQKRHQARVRASAARA
jgi:DNA-binding transcriptional LysR family regulator